MSVKDPPQSHAWTPEYRRDLSEILLGLVAMRRQKLRRTILVGLAGPQGSGKSTLANRLSARLRDAGLRPAVLSLDDFYLTRAERQALAADVHPLLAVRGPPGTHDLALLEAVVDRLLAGRSVTIPQFDKALDDRAPVSREGPARAGVVLLEGWCVGALRQDSAALAEPVNALEREADPDGVWRRFVNESLAAYEPLFARLDLLIQLRAPSFDTVADWRWEQEAKLRAATADDPNSRVMDEAAIRRFVQHYERITREMFEKPRADLVVDLDADRRLLALRGLDVC